MKHVIILLGVMLCAALPTPMAFASDEADPIKIIPKSDKPNRPHDEETAVVCYYDNGDISISFESYEGMATATVTNVFTAEAESWNFSTATLPSVHYIGTAPGTYTISITTPENTYEGIFSID